MAVKTHTIYMTTKMGYFDKIGNIVIADAFEQQP